MNEAKTWMTDAVTSCERAIKMFESISGWKDADEQIIACQKKIEEIEAKEEAKRLEKERQAEIARKEAERMAKQYKKIAIITTPIVCTIIAFIIVLNTVIIPNVKYNNALQLIEKENYFDAYVLLCSLEDYKDSKEKANSIYDNDLNNKEKLKIAKVGDHVFFGAYEQDGDTSNGKEDIEWLVLARENNRILVISEKALDSQPYNENYVDITWETCTLRKWLNGAFLKSAFSEAERAMIPTVTVSADKNPKYDTNPGNATQDKVFLLSITEAEKYFTTDEARKCVPTEYAIDQGARTSDSYTKNGEVTCWRWLRSPGNFQYDAAYVYFYGGIYEFGNYVISGISAVRPVLWIDPEF